MRINKFLANYLGISRRKADEMICTGLVKTNDKPTKLGDRIDTETIVYYKKNQEWVPVRVNNQKSIVYYKPIFTLVSRSNKEQKRTIYQLLPKRYHTYKPAGRLDYMSEGLLILSQDGDFIHQLTHPKHNVVKEYIVGLNKQITSEDINSFYKGLVLDNYKLQPVQVKKINTGKHDHQYLKLDMNSHWYTFTLHEGRNNQIRKMCYLKNYKVRRLIRIKHGPYSLNEKLKKEKIIELE